MAIEEIRAYTPTRFTRIFPPPQRWRPYAKLEMIRRRRRKQDGVRKPATVIAYKLNQLSVSGLQSFGCVNIELEHGRTDQFRRIRRKWMNESMTLQDLAWARENNTKIVKIEPVAVLVESDCQGHKERRVL